MMHITCDLCGKSLRPGEDHRFVVKVEVFAAHDPSEITEADLDDDHMEAVSDLLQEMEDGREVEAAEPPYQHFRYDLCPECRRKFVANPLNREPAAAQKFGFSEN
jgi:hypothetical protein